jgi:RNA polymerase sigma-70 factor (ECF subfamily)
MCLTKTPRPDARLDLENVPGPADDVADDAVVVNSLYRRALEYVRGEYNDRTWQAFWRTAIDERSVADVAAELGMTAAAIRQAKSRVLRQLKQELGELLA